MTTAGAYRSVLWRTQIMPLKVARRQDGLAELPAIARAMRYAGQNGADVILHGYTLTLRNPTEETIANLRALFGRTGTKHIVQVAAAGDRGHDLGRKERRPGLASLISDQGLFLFPVSLGVDTVIAVAAHDEFAAQLAPSSNRGPGVVQMAGPGVNVLSTLPANRYGYRDGSAAAAAYVAGSPAAHQPLPGAQEPPAGGQVPRPSGTLLENPEILTSLHYQFTHPPVLTGTLYDETPFRFPQGFCGSNTYDTDLFDADGDGDLDLLEVNGNPGTGVSNTRLYLNNGGGRFTHAPVANLGTTAQNLNVLEADEGDIDQDGDDDIILASFTPPAPDSNKKEILLLNQGNLQGGTEGTFTAASDELPDNFDVSRDVDFCDFNGDGFPDVFVTNVDGDRVLRNIMTAADKTCLTTSTDCFADMTASWLAGMAVGDGHNSRCVDVDADGDLDVVTMNLNTGGPSGQNVLLINRINEVTAALVNETAVWNLPLEFDTSHGIVAGDIDDDNDDATYGGPGDDSDLIFARRQFGAAGMPQHNKVLVKADAASFFQDLTFGSDGVPGGAPDRLPNVAEASTEAVLCRIDSDGDPDLLEANGDANYDVRVQNRFYRNKTSTGVDAGGRGSSLTRRARSGSRSATSSSRRTSNAATSTGTPTSTWWWPTTPAAPSST